MLLKCVVTGLFVIGFNYMNQLPNSSDESTKLIAVKLQLEKCGHGKKANKVTFIIKNLSHRDITINAHLLLLNSISSVDGKKLIPLKLIEYTAPPIKKYVTLKKDSTIQIQYETDFFSNYSLTQDHEYWVQASYKSGKINGSKFSSGITAEISPVKFSLCKE